MREMFTSFLKSAILLACLTGISRHILLESCVQIWKFYLGSKSCFTLLVLEVGDKSFITSGYRI